MNDITNKNKNFYELILYTIFAVDLGAYFFEMNALTRYLPFLLGIPFIYYVASRSIEFILISLSLTFIFILCMLYNQDSSLNIITILINLAIGLYLFTNNPRKNPYLILLVISSLVLGVRYYLDPDNIEFILASGSSNYLSVIFLSLSLLYYTFIPNKNERVILYPAILSVIFSTLATGRSGIAASLFLLIGVFFYNVTYIKKTKFIKCIYLGASLASIYFIVSFADIIYNLDQPSSLLWRFSFGLENDGRLLIFNEYIRNLTFLDFLLGRGNEYVQAGAGMSIHISYLQWHITLGFAAFLIYAIVIVGYLKILHVNKLYFILMSVLLMRASTDHIMLSAGFIFGPLLIYYCMHAFFPNDNHKTHHHY